MIEKNTISRINDLHNQFTRLLKKSLNLALEIGKELYQIKESLPHGEFTSWIKNNLELTPRTARNYLKLHNNRDRLQGVDSITDAYKMLKPKTETVSDLETIKQHLESLGIRSLLPEKGGIWLYSGSQMDSNMEGGVDVLWIKKSEHKGYLNPSIMRLDGDSEYAYEIYNKRGGLKIETTEQLIKIYKRDFDFLGVFGIA